MACTTRTVLILTAIITVFSVPHALAEWSHDPVVNNLVCGASGDQTAQQIVSDGAGGAVIVWEDRRTFDPHIYAQRMDRDGVPLWDPDGVRVCTYDSYQVEPLIVADGLGSYLIAWIDRDSGEYDIFAQRLTNSGTLDWSNFGQPVCTGAGTGYDLSIATDGAGKLLVAWSDTRDTYPDIYAQMLDTDGARQWGDSGSPVCTASAFQESPGIVSDGAGGALVAWQDIRGVPRIYAQHMSAAGAPEWTIDGEAISPDYGEDLAPIMEPDGSGGAYVAWKRLYNSVQFIGLTHINPTSGADWATHNPGGSDHYTEEPCLFSPGDGKVFVGWSDHLDGEVRIRVQCFDSIGSRLWVYGGVSATPAASAEIGQYRPDLAGDGHGGVTACWEDFRTGYSLYAIYGQRFNTYGQRVWSDQGALVSLNNLEDYSPPGIIRNTEDDFILAWTDWRGFPHHDIFAQLLDDTGFLGRPAPAITQVNDFPNDQGGQVIVDWTASYLDSYDWLAVDTYSVWARESEGRQSGSNTDKAHQLANCIPLDTKAAAAAVERLQLTAEHISRLYREGWTYVLEVPAMLQPEYSCVAFTFGDSTSTGIPWADYMVVAHGAVPQEYWPSDPVSGYSTDNLAPGAPMSLNGEPVSDEEVELTWLASGHHDEDLAFYVVYRGDASGFPLDETHRIGETADLTYLDLSGAGSWFYRVTATDVHENESPGSNEIEVLVGASNADDASLLPDVTRLYAAQPNPVTRRAAIRFDLSQASTVDLGIWSVAGRRVATLAAGAYPAGRHVIDWRGCDDNGRALPHGLYFTRLKSGSFAGQQRLLLIR